MTRRVMDIRPTQLKEHFELMYREEGSLKSSSTLGVIEVSGVLESFFVLLVV